MVKKANLRCQFCSNQFQMPVDKGMKYIPQVCSAQCLWSFLVSHFVPISLFDKGKHENLITITQWKNKDKFVEKFRSHYEQIFSNWIVRGVVSHLYEPLIFDNNYVPDFLIGQVGTTKGLFVEVKGTWEDGALPKIQRFARYLESEKVPIFIINSYLIGLIKKEKIKQYDKEWKQMPTEEDEDE